MQVKRYEAVNIQDALAKIKSDMGPDAIVLSTKRLPGDRKLIEVLAAKDNGQKEQEMSSPKSGAGEEAGSASENRELFTSLQNEIGELKSMLRDAGRQARYEEFVEFKDCLNTFFDILGLRENKAERDSLPKIYAYLLGRGISKAKACHLLDKMRQGCPSHEVTDYDRGLKIAQELLKETFIEKGERECRVKVLVGPTGVGKTTTLAKLAARYALEQKKAVGLITTDTYRIAAVEQLKTYARIMGLPLEVVTGRETFHQSMKRFRDKDCILVDTPGRGRGDAGHLPALKEILTGNWDLETNLLISLTSSRESMMDVVDRYSAFGFDQIILTKLDECTQHGIFCDVVERINKPVSYVSTGQNVPQDIEQVTPHRLAEMVMRH
jgi:flagellar biosynthesis protein FlhF